MGIRIGIGSLKIGQGSTGVDWSSYWTQRSLFFLDGTIITVGENKYFEDKSVNDRHFLITGYDFATDWTTGFPYKSAATISAPAADAALIAADINNFLYAADETPNQIPVVSLFQNIDYENTIYCKHEAQVLDANGVETYEPRVSEVFMTASALSATDLVKANTYFGVPAEVTTNVLWVAKDGNDTTGNGTKASPYLTINKAITANRTIYVKTGAYSESSGDGYLAVGVACLIIGLGNVVVSPSGAGSQAVLMAGNNAVTMKGITVSTTKNYGILASSGTKTINRCKVSGAVVYEIWGQGTAITVIDSILITSGFVNYATTGNLTGCYVGTIDTKYSVLADTGTTTLNIKYNKIIPTGTSTRGRAISTPINGTINILDNYFNLSALNGQRVFLGLDTYTQTLNFNDNYIYSSALATVAALGTSNNYVGTVSINRNTFNYTNNGNFNDLAIVSLPNQVAPSVEDNIFLFNTTYGIRAVSFTSAGATIGDAVFSGNYIKTLSLSGHTVMFGIENSGGNDNKITPIITNNRIQGAYDFGNTNASTLHAIFVGHNVNPIIRYNYVSGCGIALVLKHENSGAYVTDLISGNLFKNCQYGFYVKGVDGAKIYNNTCESVFSPAYAYYVELHAGAGSQTQNNILKNNIFVTTGLAAYSIPNGGGVGLESDYNVLKTGAVAVKYNGSDYSFAQWQAAGFDEHSTNEDPQLTAMIPAAPIIGDDLGEDYDDGLDTSTDWGSDTAVPIVVTKQQGATWDCGAYIH